MQEFQHFCILQDKLITLHSADVCEVCGAEDLVNNRHMQDGSADEFTDATEPYMFRKLFIVE
jgi:hypothetical protein